MAVRRLVATLTLCAVAHRPCGTAAGWELLDANRTALVVIDAQQNFLDKLPLAQRASLVERIAFVMKVAKAMELPILAMAEDYARGGSNPPMHPSLSALLPAGTRVWNKLVWNSTGSRTSGPPSTRSPRRAASMSSRGLETDVSVAQSALGLKAAGRRRRRRGRRRHAAAPPRRRHPETARRGRAHRRGVLRGLRDVPTVARVAREIGGAPVVGEDALHAGARATACRRATLHTPHPVFLLLRSQSHGPARDDGLGLGARAAARAFAGPGSFQNAPGQCPRSRGNALVARDLLLPLLQSFLGPNSRTNPARPSCCRTRRTGPRSTCPRRPRPRLPNLPTSRRCPAHNYYPSPSSPLPQASSGPPIMKNRPSRIDPASFVVKSENASNNDVANSFFSVGSSGAFRILRRPVT